MGQQSSGTLCTSRTGKWKIKQIVRIMLIVHVIDVSSRHENLPGGPN